MLTPFRLILSNSDKSQLKTIGSFENFQKKIVKKNLEGYIGIDSSLDGSKLSEDWFPKIDADVFISHSHKDEKIALGLKEKIEKKTNYKCFVDSSVWGNSKDLLEEIDRKYCKSGKDTYNYKERNYSTSHVYLMLNVALQKMIFKSQFVIFLDTPKSISVENTINSSTNSPWIYSEISTVWQICNMQRNLQKSLLSEERNFSNLNIEYKLDFSDFEKIKSIDELLSKLNGKPKNYFPY